MNVAHSAIGSALKMLGQVRMHPQLHHLWPSKLAYQTPKQQSTPSEVICKHVREADVHNMKLNSFTNLLGS